MKRARDRCRRLARVSHRQPDDQFIGPIQFASLALDDPLSRETANDAIVVVSSLSVVERAIDG